ncbi:MAG TPA: anion permease [Planctomycetota bacterium]|jgi:PiT family inorganic phosphate transporter
MFWIVFSIIVLALAFDFVNGFHDAANSIATVVSTRVLSPRVAVAWAAFFNFVAFLFFGLHVATTIGKGVVQPDAITLPVVTAGLVGALVWDLITWYAGLPTSSSHALVGGFAGAALVHSGFDTKVLVIPGLVKIAAFIVISPLVGLILGYILMSIVHYFFYNANPARASSLFRKLQIFSAAAYSLGHGGNDAQKTMGIILAVLIAGGYLNAKSDIPFWVVLACQTAMGLGTLCGGWRIVKTMGQKICLLQPVHGFSAETAGSTCLYAATWLGIPVSTTHTITGAIVGVGSTRSIRSVKWGVAGRVMWAWVLTIPAAAIMAVLTWWIFSTLGWK